MNFHPVQGTMPFLSKGDPTSACLLSCLVNGGHIAFLESDDTGREGRPENFVYNEQDGLSSHAELMVFVQQRRQPPKMHYSKLTLLASAATEALSAPSKTAKRVSKFQWFGVNESGAEFGNNVLPGTLGK